MEEQKKQKYIKTKEDCNTEAYDLRNNQVMKYLRNPDAFKFTVGDILIKKTRSFIKKSDLHEREEVWVTEKINNFSDAPKKYLYAFENELGIGYVRQLKADGQGYTTYMMCTANLDPDNVRFEVDPDYADTMLLGGDTDVLQPNDAYLQAKKYREDAMNTNRKMLVNTRTTQRVKEWFKTLKVGDEFWCGGTFDQLTERKYQVTNIVLRPDVDPNNAYSGDDSYIETKIIIPSGPSYAPNRNGLRNFLHKKISMKTPVPMRDINASNKDS